MLDPIAAARRIEDSYRRYLTTTLRPRDPELRSSFEKLLTKPENRLGKGPILQASAPYAVSSSVGDLIAAGVLSPDFAKVDQTVLPLDRPLYAHQVEAVVKVIAGDNVLVATGTGSGKTESFLLPIINALLLEREDGTLGSPGVRALLMYPMNALANDQLKRLRQLLAEFPDITFGRYTGETEEKYDKALAAHRQLLGVDPLPNELISREEIVERPPHILITNYAMLEYLLLRPRDSEIFDGPTGKHWKFLVLDEIHTHDGSKGSEIGYLLRRLRDRTVLSERGALRCIGTSATLGSGVDALERIIDFAEELFDEPFNRWSLVLPQRRPLDDLIGSWSITSSQVERLIAGLSSDGSAQESAVDFSAMAIAAGCPVVEAAGSIAETLGRLLSTERHVGLLRRLLANGARDVRQVVEEMPADLDLVRLVELAWRAVDEEGNPLIPARYHLLLRSLEGAFICLDPDHPAGDRMYLDRFRQCPSCAKKGKERRLFEFGACRRCGAGYVLGRGNEVNDAGSPVLEPPLLHDYRLVHLLLDAVDEGDEDNQVEEIEDQLSIEAEVLCLACGTFGSVREVDGCCADQSLREVSRVEPGKGGILRKCGSCGGHTSGNVVFRFLSGADAAGSVVATAMYQEIPADPASPDAPVDLSAGGRKLLTFSDSRQDAAFFANFMQRTHDRSLWRRIIWEALSRLALGEPEARPRFDDLVTRTKVVADEFEAFEPGASPMTKTAVVRKWLFAELVSLDTAQGLEGVGLARISPAAPEGLVVPGGLLPPGMSSEGAVELVLALLSTLRARNVVSVPEGVDMTDQIFAPRHFNPWVRGSGADRQVVAWSPGPTGRNSRLDLVERYFTRHSITADVRTWLADVWGWLSHQGSPWRFALKPGNDPRVGAAFRLAVEQFEFLVAGPYASAHVCSVCRSISWFDTGICPRFRCLGTLEPTGSDETNHYHYLYTAIDPVPARVEEHTAQLANFEAAERQARFVRGAINILSCSTTFELGVDVGEIQSVLMRNVPPGPANYVQRAGRAGRRKGSPALVVTMAQRRNHDLHFFARPNALIDGEVSPPVIKVANAAIARRHVHSVALAAFLRQYVDEGGKEPVTVEDFYEVADGADLSLAAQWVEWLESHPSALRDALCRLLPDSVAQDLGVDVWAWVEQLLKEDDNHEGAWLELARHRHAELVEALAEQRQRLFDAGRDREAAQVGGVLKNIRSTRMLSDLARNIILPKYGFPVDTVPLDLTRGRRDEERARHLELDRDLSVAIVEFAPGGQVVADKFLWTSVGVVIPRGLEVQKFSLAECRECGSMKSIHAVLEADATCDICDGPMMSRGQFIWPQFGFVGESVGPAGDQRPHRNGSAEMHFSQYLLAPLEEEQTIGGRPVVVRWSPHGQVLLVNGGTGGRFRFCRLCGRMETPPDGAQRKAAGWKHKRPGSGNPCGGTTFESVQLGHQYRTDVVEIRLDSLASRDEYMSALQALLAALPALAVKSDDVAGLLTTYSVGSPPGLLLVDSVPGGAGHSRMLAEHLQELIDAAVTKLEQCSCGLDTSCYGCLRTYRNQQHHDRLSRQGGLNVLQRYARSRVGVPDV